MRPFRVEISTVIKEKIDGWKLPIQIERGFYRDLIDILEPQSAFDFLKHTELGHMLEFNVEAFTFTLTLRLRNETFEVLDLSLKGPTRS